MKPKFSFLTTLPYIIASLLIIIIGCEKRKGKVWQRPADSDSWLIMQPISDTAIIDTSAWITKHSELTPLSPNK